MSIYEQVLDLLSLDIAPIGDVVDLIDDIESAIEDSEVPSYRERLEGYSSDLKKKTVEDGYSYYL